MLLAPKKIKSLVRATEKMIDAKLKLNSSLYILIRDGYSREELAPIFEEIESIGANLDSLQQKLFEKIYK